MATLKHRIQMVKGQDSPVIEVYEHLKPHVRHIPGTSDVFVAECLDQGFTELLSSLKDG